MPALDLLAGVAAGVICEGSCFQAVMSLFKKHPQKPNQHRAPRGHCISSPPAPCRAAARHSSHVDYCPCWADELLAIVISLPDGGAYAYSITNIRGERLSEVEGCRGQLTTIPEKSDFPLDVNFSFACDVNRW